MNRVAVTILALGLIACLSEAKPNFLAKKEADSESAEKHGDALAGYIDCFQNDLKVCVEGFKNELPGFIEGLNPEHKEKHQPVAYTKELLEEFSSLSWSPSFGWSSSFECYDPFCGFIGCAIGAFHQPDAAQKREESSSEEEEEEDSSSSSSSNDAAQKKEDSSSSSFSSSSNGLKTQKARKMMAKKFAIMKAMAKKSAMAKKALH